MHPSVHYFITERVFIQVLLFPARSSSHFSSSCTGPSWGPSSSSQCTSSSSPILRLPPCPPCRPETGAEEQVWRREGEQEDGKLVGSQEERTLGSQEERKAGRQVGVGETGGGEAVLSPSGRAFKLSLSFIRYFFTQKNRDRGMQPTKVTERWNESESSRASGTTLCRAHRASSQHTTALAIRSYFSRKSAM